ncbi:MAG: energy transducer TonB [Algoriphagus sp.]|nr:energy transducer TonB [Algoriphagus sp.]
MLDVNSNSLERKSGIQSALVTFVIQLLLFLAFYFMIVWEQPNPPTPTYGLELNLGFSDFGSGDPSEVLSNTSEIPIAEAPAPGEIAPSAQPAVSPTNASASRAKPSTSKAVSTQPSPIKGETVATPTTLKEEAKEVSSNQEVEEQPKLDQRAVFGAGGKSGKGSNPTTVSGQGKSTAAGDQGKPTGTVDGRALQGSGSDKGTAGGAGYSLDLAGWDFASRPSINDRVSTRNGRIVFNITVDGSGKVVQALVHEYNVSNEVVAYYRQVVNQLDFKKSGGSAAEFSKGKITFVIKVD